MTEAELQAKLDQADEDLDNATDEIGRLKREIEVLEEQIDNMTKAFGTIWEESRKFA